MKGLNNLNINQTGYVARVSAPLSIRRRFSDIGIIKGTKIECVDESPFGDPKAYLIKGAVIAIRNRDASGILVEDDYGRR